jgi:DeoR/GlpR family transcriptional regulator of sugar metabolism
MGERGERLVVRKRKELYWGILKGNVNNDVNLDFLVEAAKSLYKDSIGIDACRGTLTDMRYDRCPLPGGVLTVGRRTVRLEWEEMLIDQRQQRRPRVKRLLGALVWEVLFGDVMPKRSKYEQLDWTPSLRETISILRRRPLVTLAMDAGSTTLAVATELNRLKTMPLRIEVSDDEDAEHSLVRCNIISNSVKIIEEIRNGRHRDDIDLTIIGGSIRGQRASVCGMSAQAFLDQCAIGGDAAIIGTTGYGGINGERRSFYSDNLEEAILKTTLLNRAFLRILVFDSSKLVARAVTRVFSDLSPKSIDLIVTDDGHDFETPANCEQEVQEFRKHSQESGVSVAMLKLGN